MRRVVFREEREEERYVIQSITFQDQVSVSFNRLTKDGRLRSSEQNALKHTVSHFLINCIALQEGSFDGRGGGGRGRGECGGAGQWKAMEKGSEGQQVSSLLLKEMPLAVMGLKRHL